MKALACFLLLFCAQAYAKKVLWSEQLVFKIEEKIYLLDDINRIGKGLKEAQCLLPDSLLLKHFGLDKGAIPLIPEYQALGTLDLSEDHLYLERVLKIEKLENFVERQNIKLDYKGAANLPYSKCALKGIEEASLELKSLLKLEAYWTERFAPEFFKLNAKELEELKKKAPRGSNLQKLIEEEQAKKVKDSAENFIRTFEKQVPHEAFF